MNNTSTKNVFYECECPHLHRGLPFRSEFEQAIFADITEKFPPSHYSHLVYVSQGPGGFLSDITLITQLLASGYTTLDLIFIEPLYETNADILYACLAVKTWCKEQSNAVQKVIPHFYKTIAEYEQACQTHAAPKGNIFITIDPDDKKTIPDFSRSAFRKKFSQMFAGSMNPSSNFYYLYFQSSEGNNYRHMIIGEHTLFEQKPLLTLRHFYGEQTVYEHAHTHVFLNNEPVYPFNNEKQMVQIGKRIVTNAHVAALFNYYNQRNSKFFV